MTAPIQVSPDWITAHAHLAAWLLSTCLLGLFALGGYFTKRLFTAINTGLNDIRSIKDTQTTQASNHLSHIESYSLETRDATKELGAKLDVLIAVLSDRNN